ncbi:hypothetical protein E2542_SST02339 [Spatholobus suberectus]|nr:hypothetical protein E2542_SST02339 [Spatholobus suberectus]
MDPWQNKWWVVCMSSLIIDVGIFDSEDGGLVEGARGFVDFTASCLKYSSSSVESDRVCITNINELRSYSSSSI